MSHDDFAPEPVLGLPERLPEGEHILWQGKPRWRPLARRAFACRTVAIYFAALTAGSAALAWADGSAASALVAGSWVAALGGVAVALLAVGAWLTARHALYTITNRRVAMRIGIALTVTVNLPYSRIASADLALDRDGSGDIALTLAEGQRLAWFLLWPHCRPWHISRPHPAMRALPDVAEAASVLAEAMRAAEAERLADRAAPARIAAE